MGTKNKKEGRYFSAQDAWGGAKIYRTSSEGGGGFRVPAIFAFARSPAINNDRSLIP